MADQGGTTDWTIDTCVLYLAARADVDAMYLLLRVLQQAHHVAFDHEGCIQREYRHCVESTGNPLLRKWFKASVDKLAVFFTGSLSSRHRGALRKLKFHRDDLPFVGVCSRTQSKNLVSEDSDYTREVSEYLSAQMGICVQDIAASLAICG